MKPLKSRAYRSASRVDRWIISYADLMTLLVVFFIVISAISTVDHSKYTQLSDATKHEFPTTAPLPSIIQQKRLDDLATLLSQPDTELVEIHLAASTLFEPKSAEPTAFALAAADKIARFVKDKPYQLRVEGHAAAGSQSDSLYPSGWELSAVQAGTLTRLLNERGLPAETLSALATVDQSQNRTGELDSKLVILIKKS